MQRKDEKKPETSPLGKALKQTREFCGLTLRQVEEATGVSNAYLSQLENGKINKPSANVLYKLSQIYGVSIEKFLEAAGIIRGDGSKSSFLLYPVPDAELTPTEQEKLMEYLRFLRWKRRTDGPEVTTQTPTTHDQ